MPTRDEEVDPIDHPFLAGGGVTGDLIRSMDWSKTPVGPISSWPSSLKSAIGMILHSRLPMFIGWGPDFIQFYNDAYLPSFGVGKHPAAMGQRGQDCWGADTWPAVWPQIDDVMSRGKASWNEDAPLPVLRNGRLEEAYWTYGFSPLYDDEGRIGGTLVVSLETTARVLADRRLHTIRTLGDRTAGCVDLAAVMEAAFEVVAAARVDIPFALTYGVDEATGKARRTTSINLEGPPLKAVDSLVREHLDSGAPKEPTLTRSLTIPATVKLPGPCAEPSWQAFIVPLETAGGQTFVFGVSSGLPFDAAYRAFLDRFVERLERALARVDADRLRVVSEVTRSFAEAAMDYELLLDTVARKLSEEMKAICSVSLLSEDGETLDPVSMHSPDPEALRETRALLAANTIRVAEHPVVQKTLLTGDPFLTPRLDPARMRSALSASTYALQGDLGIHSHLWVALRLRGQSLGLLSLARFGADAPAFDERDRDLALILANHAALAIGNARSHAAERAARLAAEESEHELEASEGQHRLMLATAAEAIVMTDAAGQILFANQMMDRIFGFEPGELTGLSIDTLVPERVRGAHARDRAEYAAAPSPRPMGRDRNLVGRRKDGTEFPIEVVLSSMKREGGAVSVAFVSDITRRRESEKKVLDYQETLRRMAFDATVVEERERRRIAVLLHDGIGQDVALAQIKVTSVRQAVSGAPRAALDEAVALLAKSAVDRSTLIFELSPPVLYDLGISAALSWLTEEVARRYGMRVAITDDDAEKPLDDTAASIVFRSVRELLMNVFKHSKTLAAKMSLRRTGDQLEVLVEDAGVGFEPEAVTPGANEGGFGLFSLREQISRLGGTVQITSAPGQGTSARVRVPLKRAEPPTIDPKAAA